MVSHPLFTYNTYGLGDFNRIINLAFALCGSIDNLYSTLATMEIEIPYDPIEFYNALSVFIQRYRAEKRAKKR